MALSNPEEVSGVMTDLAQPTDTGLPAEVATGAEAQAEEFARFLRWFDADWFPARPEELINRLGAVGAPTALVERFGALLAIPAAPLTSPGELWRAINHPDLQASPPPQPPMSDLRTGAVPNVRHQHGPRNPRVVLDVDAAEEVADLIAERSCGVDEALLDDALDAIADAQPELADDDRRRAAAGHAVAMELSPEASDAIETLIRRGDPIRPRLRHRLRDRLRHNIHQARRRRVTRDR